MFSLRMITREVKTSRIGALSDGVLAIVMTLLVIELVVPEVPKLFAAEQLHLKLIEMWPKFAAFVLSFITLGVFWSFHHIMFQHIKHANEKVVWINILYLMFAALVPFSTAMLGEYTIFATIAVVLWGANVFLIMLMINILWWYVTKNKHFLNEDVHPMEVRQIKINAGVGTIVLLVTIGVSFISPYIGIAMYILLILWGIVAPLTSTIYHPGSENNKLTSTKRNL